MASTFSTHIDSLFRCTHQAHSIKQSKRDPCSILSSWLVVALIVQCLVPAAGFTTQTTRFSPHNWIGTKGIPKPQLQTAQYIKETKRCFNSSGKTFLCLSAQGTYEASQQQHGGTTMIERITHAKQSLKRFWQRSRDSVWSFITKKNRMRSTIAAMAMALCVLFCVHKFSPGLHQIEPKSMATGAQSILQVARGGSESYPPSHFIFFGSPALEETAKRASTVTKRTLNQAMRDLGKYMKGPRSDSLILLAATALITPICKRLKTSPIIGFLASGMLLGPAGYGLIRGIHTTETLAELGIVFFLFEMGIELSVERLLNMRKDVFGLGLCQFTLTAILVAIVGSFFGLPGNALVVLGGGLALSSSAFVLQLLKDKKQLATRFGKAAFGVLLFQDLAVVPLLVVTPILAGKGTSVASAVGSAVVKAALALSSIAIAGRTLINPLFKIVAQAHSQEAFLGMILLSVLSMSFMTEGLGLSNTLGAFLAGVLLSETKYRYQVEADIAPFRGILLGLFFITVGFEIDVHLIAANFPLVSAIVVGTILIKALVLTGLSLAFGLSLSTSQQTGLILSQGGEFAFVAFGLARSLGILSPHTTKLLLTSVSLTMALTPMLSEVGAKVAKKLEEKSDFTHYLGQDRDANEIKESEEFVVVVGYGAVGKVVCDLLDRKFTKYVGLEIDPNKAIQARNKGLPVFFGDIGRPEVAEAFNVGKSKAVIVTISDRAECTRAVILLRRLYPDLMIFARAYNADHRDRLQKTLDVVAMVPILPEDNFLMTLPFGGAVLKSLGAPVEEVNAIIEKKRKDILGGRGLNRNEEATVLAQLGIEPAPENQPQGNSVATGAQGKEEQSEAVAAAVMETKERSPMVAQVIEAVAVTQKNETEAVDLIQEANGESDGK